MPDLILAIALLGIGAIVGTVSGWIAPPKWLETRRWLAVLVTFLLVVTLGAVGAGIERITAPKVSRANMVNIADKAAISRPFKVEGRAYDVPAGHELWVATPSDDMKIWYWTDARCSIDPGGGVQRPFTCPDLYLSGDENGARSYSIYLFDADADAVKELEKHASRDPSQSSQGLKKPSGATEIDVVHGITVKF